jgi:hypothetical protein
MPAWQHPGQRPSQVQQPNNTPQASGRRSPDPSTRPSSPNGSGYTLTPSSGMNRGRAPARDVPPPTRSVSPGTHPRLVAPSNPPDTRRWGSPSASYKHTPDSYPHNPTPIPPPPRAASRSPGRKAPVHAEEDADPFLNPYSETLRQAALRVGLTQPSGTAGDGNGPILFMAGTGEVHGSRPGSAASGSNTDLYISPQVHTHTHTLQLVHSKHI